MRLIEAVRMALRTIWAQKLKSFFSLIGVLIGVTFLIAVVSIVQGMNVYVETAVTDEVGGVNSFQLRQRPNFTGGDVDEAQWRTWWRRPRISYDDAEYLRERMTVPATFANYCADRVTLEYDGKRASDIELRGTEESYFDLKAYELAAGRVFVRQEVRAGSPVVLLGFEVADRLFEGEDPLGKSVKIAGIPYRVIGVVESQGTLFGMSQDKFAIMPYSAPGRRLICPLNVMDQLMIRPDNPQQLDAAVGEVEALMRARRQLKPDEANNFTIETADEALDFWEKISTVLFTALPLLVGISLVVGGIVIMNIMLMAVSERTREIGIRKAIGAKRGDILSQFVVEAATLSVAGAAIGILAGLGLAFIVKALTPFPAAVAPWSIGLGVTLGILVGVVAGVYPAIRASRLDPITALRAE
ncbi:MAG TPA: ABC transporter permease [Gemmatimonadales bacterium]|nr:ABC transporter permease [Gemmatimonadales bacterium]